MVNKEALTKQDKDSQPRRYSVQQEKPFTQFGTLHFSLSIPILWLAQKLQGHKEIQAEHKDKFVVDNNRFASHVTYSFFLVFVMIIYFIYFWRQENE